MWQMLALAVCGRLTNDDKEDQRGWHSTLRFTVYRSRLQDPDNAVASLKPIIDAIRRLGWLTDDSEKYLTLVSRQEKCSRQEERTEVTWLIEAEDELRA